MLGGQAALDPLFKLLHFAVRADLLDRDDGVVDVGFVGLVDELSGGERNDAGGAVAHGVALRDAHDLEDEAVHADELAERIGALEEHERRFLVDERRFAVLADVGFVDETPLGDLDPLDPGHLGQRAAQRGFHEVAPVGEFLRREPGVGRYLIDLGELLFEDLQVAVREADAAVAVVALPLLRGPASVEGDRVGGVVPEVRLHAVLQPVARAEQDDEHEDAPRD